MRFEAKVFSISWIPMEAITGMPKLPFEAGITHYDMPPPEVVEDLEPLRKGDAFREANELKAWIEVSDGKILDCGYSGGGHLGVTRVKLASRELTFPAVAFPVLQAPPERGPTSVRFVQTVGGRMSLPAPRRVKGKPFVQIHSSAAWTTLALTIHADGSSEFESVGASPFPRHWIYDNSGKLSAKSGVIDFKKWYRESFGEHTPWGGEETAALLAGVESAIEREISKSILKKGAKLKSQRLKPGDTLVEQGSEGRELFLLMDGMLDVEVDGQTVAQVGPGAILGERAILESRPRTATLRAATPCNVIIVPGESISEEALAEVAKSRR